MHMRHKTMYGFLAIPKRSLGIENSNRLPQNDHLLPHLVERAIKEGQYYDVNISEASLNDARTEMNMERHLTEYTYLPFKYHIEEGSKVIDSVYMDNEMDHTLEIPMDYAVGSKTKSKSDKVLYSFINIPFTDLGLNRNFDTDQVNPHRLETIISEGRFTWLHSMPDTSANKARNEIERWAYQSRQANILIKYAIKGGQYHAVAYLTNDNQEHAFSKPILISSPGAMKLGTVANTSRPESARRVERSEEKEKEKEREKEKELEKETSAEKDEFLCPITLEVMKDPVLTENGLTYERSVIEEWLQNNNTEPLTGAPIRNKKLIPNRALKNAIEGWQKEIEGAEKESEREEFLCPITMDIMKDPVTTENGYTYERAAIEKWLATNSKEPLSGVAIRNKTLIPNIALKKAIESEQHDAKAAKVVTPTALPPSHSLFGININSALKDKNVALTLLKNNLTHLKPDQVAAILCCEHRYDTDFVKTALTYLHQAQLSLFSLAKAEPNAAIKILGSRHANRLSDMEIAQLVYHSRGNEGFRRQFIDGKLADKVYQVINNINNIQPNSDDKAKMSKGKFYDFETVRSSTTITYMLSEKQKKEHVNTPKRT